MKDEAYDLLADSLKILNRWMYFMSQLWNVIGVRHIEVHRSETAQGGLSLVTVRIIS
jgi:hypothetical protein